MTQTLRKNTPRRARRKACALKARFSAETGPFHGQVTDLSLFGAFVDTTKPLPARSALDLFMELPGGNSVKTRGQVVWSQETMGMGVEFTDLIGDSRDHIERILSGLT